MLFEFQTTDLVSQWFYYHCIPIILNRPLLKYCSIPFIDHKKLTLQVTKANKYIPLSV